MYAYLCLCVVVCVCASVCVFCLGSGNFVRVCEYKCDKRWFWICVCLCIDVFHKNMCVSVNFCGCPHLSSCALESVVLLVCEYKKTFVCVQVLLFNLWVCFWSSSAFFSVYFSKYLYKFYIFFIVGFFVFLSDHV